MAEAQHGELLAAEPGHKELVVAEAEHSVLSMTQAYNGALFVAEVGQGKLVAEVDNNPLLFAGALLAELLSSASPHVELLAAEAEVHLYL